MGDRTYTVVIVSKAYAELVDMLIAETHDNIDETELDDNIKKYIDYEANGGEIGWLESLLEENVIPYDKYWEAGSEYGPGAKHVRIRIDEPKDGIRLDIKEYADAEASVLASDIVRLFETEGPDAALARAKKAVEAVRPLDPPIDEAPFTAFHHLCLQDLKQSAARHVGSESAKKGLERTPALCSGFLELVANMDVGDDSEAVTSAWLKGYDAAAGSKISDKEA